MARTDAFATHGLDQALKRGESYLRDGEILFVEAPQSEIELRRIAEGLPGVANRSARTIKLQRVQRHYRKTRIRRLRNGVQSALISQLPLVELGSSPDHETS